MENRYTIQKALDKGGVGEVFLAHDEKLKRNVALKRLLPSGDLKADTEAAQQLIDEAHILSSLQHPNIVTVYDVGQDAQGAYVVMELLKGETIEDTISRGVLTEEDFREFVTQSLEGLIAAQSAELIHRDLKPGNLMVIWLPSGNFQIKILDFGLAKFTQKPSIQTTDHSDSILGSIYFMAPEQFERHALDARTDLYSLGCIYYYALTGEYPFTGENGVQVMEAHLHHRIQHLIERRPDIPEELNNWVMWLLSRQPENRPSSATEAIEHFQNRTLGTQMLPEDKAISPHTKRIPQLNLPIAPAQAPALLMPEQEATETQLHNTIAEKKSKLSAIVTASWISAIICAILVGAYWWLSKDKRGFQNLFSQYQEITQTQEEPIFIGTAGQAKLLLNYLPDPDPSTRKKAAYMLRDLQGDGVDEVILNGLKNKELPALTHKALINITTVRNLPQALPSILRLTANSKSAALREKALHAINELTTSKDLPKLCKLFKYLTIDKDQRTLGEILRSKITQEQDPSAYTDLLLTTLDQTNARIAQAELLETLGLTGTDKAKNLLLSYLENANSLVTQAAALKALQYWKDDSIQEDLLRAITQKEKPKLRQIALKSYLQRLLTKTKSDAPPQDIQAQWTNIMTTVQDTTKLQNRVLQFLAGVPLSSAPWARELAQHHRQHNPSPSVQRIAEWTLQQLEKQREK